MIALLLDGLSAYRLTRLVTHDTLTAEQRDAIIRSAYEAAGRREEQERRFDAEFEDGALPDTWAQIVVPNDPDPPKLATLVTCPHCAGVYVAFGVVILRRLFPKWWAPVAEALALSAVTGLLADHLME